jgi:hypothetical protein
VKSAEIVPDNELLNRFVSMQKAGEFPPLDLVRPLQAKGMMGHPLSPLNFELSSSGLTFAMTTELAQTMSRSSPPSAEKQEQPAGIFIPLSSIASLEVMDVGDLMGEAFLTTDNHLLSNFSRKTPLGTKFEFYAEPRVMLALVRWIEEGKAQKGSPNPS